MLAAHYEEIARFKDLTQLSPDLERYRRLEDQGWVNTLLAFVENQAVGFCWLVVQSNLHYKGLVFCQNDVLYVAPEQRKGRIGLQLMRETCQRARTLGAKLM